MARKRGLWLSYFDYIDGIALGVITLAALAIVVINL